MHYLTIRFQNQYYTALGGMIYELERIWKEAVWLNQGTMPAMKKTMKNLIVSQDSNVQNEIQTEHLPHTSLERYL
jgi:hypothetical protein